MRFRLRKNKSAKEHGAGDQEEKAPSTESGDHGSTPSQKADDDQLCKLKSTRNDVFIEGLDCMEGLTVVSSSTTPAESDSENLLILLSIHSLSGLTISERDEPIVEATPIMRRAKQKEQPKQKRKLEEILAVHPTTVVVSSVERELTNEGYARETYLPSLVLSEKIFWKEKRSDTRICTAYWPDAETADDRSVLNKSPPSTIKLHRTMNRVVYQRDLAANRASHFRHKRIDLNISLSRGTELIRLGVASIAISGNEEDEQLINAPIRPRSQNSSPRARRWNTQQKDDDKLCFSDDPTHTVALADNATLCLGVRVVCQAIIQHEELIDEQERIFRVESDLKRERSVIHLSDDYDIVSGPSLVTSTSQRSVNSVAAGVPFLGCCVSDAFSFSMLADQFGKKKVAGPEMTQFYTSKTTEATVTPIYLLSDISESTADITDVGTEDETEAGTEASSIMFDQ